MYTIANAVQKCTEQKENRMDKKKKRTIINGLVCAAKLATIPIPDPFLQFILQESFDWEKDNLLEFTSEMPQIDDILRSAPLEIQSIVEDILSESNVLNNVKDLNGQETNQLASFLVRNSNIVRQISQDEEYQTETALAKYLTSVKDWAVQQPELLRKSLDQIWLKLNTHEQQIDSLSFMMQGQLEKIADNDKRITELENSECTILHSFDNINDDTIFYSDKFEETLFLHRKLPEGQRIRLKDIYTLPGAKMEKDYQWNKILKKDNSQNISRMDEYNSIAEAIREFLEYTPKRPGSEIVDLLFIEGKAAMGKSSLISWICWHYMNPNDRDVDIDFLPLKEVIDKYRLITVKLRDIPRSEATLLNVQSPFLQLCAYLLKISEKELSSKLQWEKIGKTLFTKTILVLEGFDELCMLEGIVGDGKRHYFQNLYRELNRMDCDCKIIVTTRPEYLNVENLDFPKAHLTISPFTKEKRQIFLNKYEEIYPISSETREILVNGKSPNLDGIVDSPLTLYMIIARNVQISDNSNLWYIYHEIFAKEVYERDYEKEGSHAISEYRTLLYRLTAEIACVVSGVRYLSITVNRLLDIKEIRNLLNNLCEVDSKSVQDILEDCFGLASYFRISEQTDDYGKTISAVEFYHNNIKDYFFCEYLWLHLEEIYSNLPSDSLERDRWFINSFQELFQNSVYLKDSSLGVRAKAIDFLESKILYLKENQVRIDFINQELQQQYFKHFFGKMLQTGMICHYEYTGEDNILQMMSCIFASVFSIYHTIYMPYLANNRKMLIAEEQQVVDIGTSFIFRILFLMSNIHNMRQIGFDGIMLSGIEFGKHNFQNCSFRGCLLIGCDFDGCDLRGADFSAASLQNADFRNAIIDDTTIFSKTTVFERTKIKREQKQYFAPWVNEGLFFAECDWVTYISPKCEK